MLHFVLRKFLAPGVKIWGGARTVPNPSSSPFFANGIVPVNNLRMDYVSPRTWLTKILSPDPPSGQMMTTQLIISPLSHMRRTTNGGALPPVHVAATTCCTLLISVLRRGYANCGCTVLQCGSEKPYLHSIWQKRRKTPNLRTRSASLWRCGTESRAR